MTLYQITPSRLRTIETRWKSIIRRYSGAAPSGLGVAHIVAESNGTLVPTIKDAKRRPIGLMQIPYRMGRLYGRSEADLERPEVSIYVWAVQTNKDAHNVHLTYPNDWTSPDLDFWLAVRLYWMLGKTTFDNLYGASRAIGTEFRKMTGLVSWIRTRMTATQHFGQHTKRTLHRTADHLDSFKTALNLLEGPGRVTDTWSKGAAITPGNFLDVLQTGALK